MAKKSRTSGTLPLPSTGGPPATVALRVLEEAGVPYTLHAYAHDPSSELSYGEEAAAALGTDQGRVFKTLVAEVDGALTVAVVPVSGSLDLKALASAVGGKRAAMADPAAAERSSGYVRGGISPLGQRKALPTVVDATALSHPTVFVSAGKRGLEVELAPAALVELTAAATAPLLRPGTRG
ncbi:Cys-tRNA(Pro) deacylase [Streptomyces sp. NBC_00669]|uniref:Cys-tRNA(Pro) deacylase n=1 Tax=Streptomyces sp. NBC_00669 TaxID=2976011 RepID=UPI002E2FBD9F|nr:Cys-tRNA(Pro) deacylase [Streptomyces sp. NBC_00669]